MTGFTFMAGTAVRQRCPTQSKHCGITHEKTIKHVQINPGMDLVSLLNVCANKKDLDTGSKLHVEILKEGLLERNPYVGSSLINMYAKCGAIGKAAQVFDDLSVKNVTTWNALISGYVHLGDGMEALKRFKKMQGEGLSPHAVTFTCALKACSSVKAIDEGEKIHDEVVRMGFLQKDIVLGNALIDMYGKCGAPKKAQEVLESLPVRDVVSWNALMSAYIKQDENAKVFISFKQMQTEGLFPDAVTFTCILKVCSNTLEINKGLIIHDEVLRKGFLRKDIILDNALVDMYARCGMLSEAKKVLVDLPVRTLAAWNALISGFVQREQYDDALICFEQMKSDEVSPDVATFVCVMKAYGSRGQIDKGRRVHNEVRDNGMSRRNIIIGNALIDMYVRCGSLSDAQRVLNEIPVRNVISWSTLIAGYAQQDQCEEAFNCFEQMQHEGISPNAVTFALILKVCGNIRSVDKGRHIHEMIIQNGMLRKDLMLGTALVDMFVKCGELAQAQELHFELPIRDAVSWTALIFGYVQQGQSEQAMEYFEQMQYEGIPPNEITFNCVLKACSSMGAIRKGIEIHNEIARKGLLEKDVMLSTGLIDMYAQCGALTKAQQVLYDLPIQSVATWNALISGYAQQGQAEEAFYCFNQMQRNDLTPNSITFISILKICGEVRAVKVGQKIHDDISRRGLLGEDIALGNALIDMYAKCGMLVRARQLLDELPVRDMVSWSALTSGYIQQEQGEEALACFEKMQCEGLSPNSIMYILALKACGSTSSLVTGRKIHDEIANMGLLENNVALGNALVDMYAKCGALETALQVLKQICVRDVMSWTALISGYAQHGQGEDALNCFHQMQLEGFYPTEVTFISVLTACSHAGLLNEGQQFYANMSEIYDIAPDIDHQTCLVDLFSRAGRFDSALAMIKDMPFPDCIPVWGALLGACQKWGNVDLGILAFEQSVQLDGSNDAAYHCMANIYAIAEMPHDVKRIQALRIKRKASMI